MSVRIEQIIEILEEVRALHMSNRAASTGELRRQAVDRVAQRRAVTTQTVRDKYERWLDFPVRNTADFDRLMDCWLRQGSDELCNVLLLYSRSDQDQERIQRFFSS